MTTSRSCFFQTHDDTVVAVMTDDATYRTTWYNELITNPVKGPEWLSTVKAHETRSADGITAAHLMQSMQLFPQAQMEILEHVPVKKIVDWSPVLPLLLQRMYKANTNDFDKKAKYILNEIGSTKLQEFTAYTTSALSQLLSALSPEPRCSISAPPQAVLLFIKLVGPETLIQHIESKRQLDSLIALEKNNTDDNTSTIETTLNAINSVEKLHAWLLTSDSSGRDKKMLLLGDKSINAIITTAGNVKRIASVIPDISTKLPKNSPALLSIQLEAAKVELTGLIADYEKRIENPGVRDIKTTLNAKQATATWLLRKVSGEDAGPLNLADSTLALAKGTFSNKLPELFDGLPQDVKNSLHDETTKDATSVAALTSGNSGAVFATPQKVTSPKYDSAATLHASL
jgi:hypothetical protein